MGEVRYMPKHEPQFVSCVCRVSRRLYQAFEVVLLMIRTRLCFVMANTYSIGLQ